MSNTSKIWGGRFSDNVNEFVQSFTASIGFDKRLAPADIEGSKQHSRMLVNIGVLTKAEGEAILLGLDQVLEEITVGTFHWSEELEDVHMNIESRLIELVGDTGRKLHTGRSRNDQVATDVRLWLSREIDEILRLIYQCQQSIVELAEPHTATIMPGFTHLQSAQPITFAHHLLAWFEMLERDRSRLLDCQERVKVSPLGSAALAGTSFDIDREFTRAQLGFTEVSRNSLDAVSDRDFAIEFLSSASLIMVHLSRWSEELVYWSSSPVRMVELPDAYCTGSSIMPQKKNPDIPELVRGKAGRVIGNLTSLLVLMKGQPLAYNRDNQEDKEPLFDTVDTVSDCLRAFAGMIPEIRPNVERMLDLASEGHPTATDLADWLVRKDVPFRDSHRISGQLVALAESKGCNLADLALSEMREISGVFDESVYEVLELENSVKSRSHVGGTAPETVATEIARIQKLLLNRYSDLREAT